MRLFENFFGYYHFIIQGLVHDDISLREGDVLQVPEYTNTVKISGAVMMPNTVSYSEGEGVKYYLGQAGGYSQHAKKSKKFIIYMNGQVV